MAELTIYDVSSIELGSLLGSGGFSSVYSFACRGGVPQRHEIPYSSSTPRLSNAYTTKYTKEEDVTDTCDSSSISMASDHSSSFALSPQEEDHNASNNDGDDDSSVFDDPNMEQHLALKTLHRRTLECPHRTQRASQDLQMELSILSRLPHHPNVIRLYGISEDFDTEPETAFLVLERLEETLDWTLREWKEQYPHNNHGPAALQSFFTKARKVAQAQRIQRVMVGLASAMKFLHSHNILYRDLKPANVGFDTQGNVRLFDFASARVLEPGTHLRKRCGTLRYMAPEVARREHYNLSADLYSFGILLWEVCSLEKPYGQQHNCQSSSSPESSADREARLESLVCSDDKYPSLIPIPSTKLKELLGACWCTLASQRPSFATILSTLEEEVERWVLAPKRQKV